MVINEETTVYRTRYFTDSGIIGSKEFVFTNYQRFKHLFYSKHEKKPKPIKGLAYESLRLVQNPGKKTDHVHKRSEN